MANSSTSLPNPPVPFEADINSQNAWRYPVSAPQLYNHNHPCSATAVHDAEAISHAEAIPHRASVSNAPCSAKDLPWPQRTLLRRHQVVLWVSVGIFEISLIFVTVAIVLGVVHAHQYDGHGGVKTALVVTGVFGFAGMVGSAAVVWLVWQWRKDHARSTSQWTVAEEKKEPTTLQEIQQDNELLKALRGRQRRLHRSQSRRRGRTTQRGERVPSFQSLTPSPTPSTSAPTANQRKLSWTHHVDLANGGSEGRDQEFEKESEVDEPMLPAQRSIEILPLQILAHTSPTPSTPRIPLKENESSPHLRQTNPLSPNPNFSSPSTHNLAPALSPIEQLYGPPSTPPPGRPLPTIPANNPPLLPLGLSPINRPARGCSPTAQTAADIHPIHRPSPQIPAALETQGTPQSIVTVLHRSPIHDSTSSALAKPTTATTKTTSAPQPSAATGNRTLFPTRNRTRHSIPSTQPSNNTPSLYPHHAIHHSNPENGTNSPPPQPPTATDIPSTTANANPTPETHLTHRPSSTTSETSAILRLRTARSLERVASWRARNENPASIIRWFPDISGNANTGFPASPSVYEGGGSNGDDDERGSFDGGSDGDPASGGGDKIPVPVSTFSSSSAEPDEGQAQGQAQQQAGDTEVATSERRRKLGERVRGLRMKARVRRGGWKGKGLGLRIGFKRASG